MDFNSFKVNFTLQVGYKMSTGENEGLQEFLSSVLSVILVWAFICVCKKEEGGGGHLSI